MPRKVTGDHIGGPNRVSGGIRIVRKRIGVAADRAGARAGFWIQLRTPVPGGNANSDEISAAGLGGGPGIWDESA